MKTVITANALLLLSVGLLITAPVAGAVTTALIVYASRRNARLGRMWVRYYKIIKELEYKLLNTQENEK